jgi:uncharacterized protein YndB with AHSA1/START domain
MKFHIVIKRSQETVFDLIRNLAGYKAWLPPSELFVEVVEIADDPVKVGTTYVDKGPTGTVHGEVIEMEPPHRIAFRQTTSFKRAFLRGALTVSVRYMLNEIGSGETQVVREAKIQTSGILTMMRPVLLGVIRKENERILQRMKLYLEARVG